MENRNLLARVFYPPRPANLPPWGVITPRLRTTALVASHGRDCASCSSTETKKLKISKSTTARGVTKRGLMQWVRWCRFQVFFAPVFNQSALKTDICTVFNHTNIKWIHKYYFCNFRNRSHKNVSKIISKVLSPYILEGKAWEPCGNEPYEVHSVRLSVCLYKLSCLYL